MYQTAAPQAHRYSANTPNALHGVALGGPPPLSNDCIVAGAVWGPTLADGTPMPQLTHLPANLDVRDLQNQLAAANAAVTTANAALTASNTALAAANAALAAHGGGAGGGAGGAGGAVGGGATHAQVIAAVDAARGIPGGAAPLPTLQDVMAELAHLRGRADAMQNYVQAKDAAAGGVAFPP
ncbi:uncharacterized protein DFL_003138 [Arthrobotrys flagrans]|uniref:Uncharacterized protein n=1 Tax=Arthrobotrys flagrans TaxID=97331 RepID=A0A437A8C6_ARTFL|nr:hypothetical protein DFL_003138 [Arthrobotrys flagrans]